MPFLAVVEHTNMVSPEAYGGRHLVYLGNYRAHDDPLFGGRPRRRSTTSKPGSGASTRRSTGRGSPGLEVRGAVRAADRDARVRPDDPGIRHAGRRALYVANMFQVYPYDRGQNYSIELAERLVEHLDT